MNDTNALLVQGFKAAKEGQRDSAYSIFCEVVNRDPNNELGWLYRAAATDDLSEAYVCLQRVLSLNPNNTKAQRGLERIQSRIEEEAGGPIATKPEEPAPTPTQSSPTNEGVKITENEVVSGFGYNQANGDYSGTQPTNQSYNPPPNVVPFPTTNRPGPTIPPFGAPPPFKDMPVDDDDNVVTDIFDRADTQPRYNMPPAMPPTRSFPTIKVEPEDDEDIGSQFSSDPNEPNFTEPNYQDEPDFAALREDAPPPKRGLFGIGSRKEEPRLQQFGGRTNTNLDERGLQQQKKTRRNLLFVLILLSVIVLILLVALLRPKSDPTVVDSGGDNSTPAVTATVDITNGANTTVAANTTVGIATTVAPTTSTQPQTATTAAPANTTVVATTTAAANPTTAGNPATTAAPPTTLVATQAVPTTAPAQPTAVRPIIYAVRGGDNLTSLAKTYNTSVDAIAAANRDPAALDQNGPLISGTTPNYQIYANTRLVIPVQRPDFRGRAAIVKQGDTLDSIAARFKVAPADILKLNGFASAGDIKVGEPILLP